MSCEELQRIEGITKGSAAFCGFEKINYLQTNLFSFCYIRAIDDGIPEFYVNDFVVPDTRL